MPTPVTVPVSAPSVAPTPRMANEIKPPIGSRSPTGRMRAFKSGAFDIALRTRSPIVPIALLGTADALPKRGFVLQGRHPIRGLHRKRNLSNGLGMKFEVQYSNRLAAAHCAVNVLRAELSNKNVCTARAPRFR